MYAITHDPFRRPEPLPRPKLKRPRRPDLLAKVPPLATPDELDAWIEACKIPCEERQPGVLTEEQWQVRRARRHVDVYSESECNRQWVRGPGGVMRAT